MGASKNHVILSIDSLKTASITGITSPQGPEKSLIKSALT